MKLISMTDFVLNEFELLENIPTQISAIKHINKIRNYANFLKQSLKLEMFVPCDDDGNVLDENEWKLFDGQMSDYSDILLKHKKAKELVIFEGRFDLIKLDFVKNSYRVYKENECVWTSISSNNKTIEDLVKYNLTLTENAIKQLGL